ncbi:MAG: sensor histidine kinase [Cytophagales bacterium]|nr:MAG: sensor histidine kinase [Cytophagales bacterium]
MLFIIHLFCISIIVILFKYTSSSSIALVSYATKIQIYLNLSFFLPLIVITITTISIISKLYQKNLDEDFAIKAKNIGNNLSLYFEEFKNEKVKKKSLNGFINQLSKYTETDINFYNNQGIAIATNQPLFFQKEILSPYLPPEVWIEIKERKNNMTMQSENIGNLHYHTVYIAIKEYNTGNLLGIIGIPFFESKQELERQMIEVFTTIINIFSLLFIIFLILSYILSKNLTIPLNIITLNIKKTTLGNTNEKIYWNTQDEIGLLISAYNQMLEKLEISKEALKNSEKEKAWREMAQQVAHEIKNPLTPMKLTIQYLNQNILLPNDEQHQKISKGLDTIHNQIELLNEIATSFSSFAKMPLPQLERIELGKLIINTVELFKTANSESITFSVPKEEYYISGDTKLLNGVFSNLLINALQSIPKDKDGLIEVNTIINQQKIQVVIKDNGIGIPEEIQDKIFLPHFSTKFSGSGIGLALAKQGIEYMGGKIWFKSSINIGTKFYIELPLIE